jgi:hypothetical protein
MRFAVLIFVTALTVSCHSKRELQSREVSVVTASPPISKAPPGAGVAQVAGYRLQLENRDGRCVLSYDGQGIHGVIDEGLRAPCEFARKGPTDDIQSYSYKDRGLSKTVVIIIGGPADAAQRDKWMPMGCGTSTQNISLRSKSVRASPVGGPNFTACPSDGLDEVFFGANSV